MYMFLLYSAGGKRAKQKVESRNSSRNPDQWAVEVTNEPRRCSALPAHGPLNSQHAGEVFNFKLLVFNWDGSREDREGGEGKAERGKFPGWSADGAD